MDCTFWGIVWHTLTREGLHFIAAPVAYYGAAWGMYVWDRKSPRLNLHGWWRFFAPVLAVGVAISLLEEFVPAMNPPDSCWSGKTYVDRFVWPAAASLYAWSSYRLCGYWSAGVQEIEHARYLKRTKKRSRSLRLDV